MFYGQNSLNVQNLTEK